MVDWQASARKRVQESNSLRGMDELLHFAQMEDETQRLLRQQAASAECERKERDKQKAAEEERQRMAQEREAERARRSLRVVRFLSACSYSLSFNSSHWP